MQIQEPLETQTCTLQILYCIYEDTWKPLWQKCGLPSETVQNTMRLIKNSSFRKYFRIYLLQRFLNYKFENVIGFCFEKYWKVLLLIFFYHFISENGAKYHLLFYSCNFSIFFSFIATSIDLSIWSFCSFSSHFLFFLYIVKFSKHLNLFFCQIEVNKMMWK